MLLESSRGRCPQSESTARLDGYGTVRLSHPGHLTQCRTQGGTPSRAARVTRCAALASRPPAPLVPPALTSESVTSNAFAARGSIITMPAALSIMPTCLLGVSKPRAPAPAESRTYRAVVYPLSLRVHTSRSFDHWSGDTGQRLGTSTATASSVNSRLTRRVSCSSRHAFRLRFDPGLMFPPPLTDLLQYRRERHAIW